MIIIWALFCMVCGHDRLHGRSFVLPATTPLPASAAEHGPIDAAVTERPVPVFVPPPIRAKRGSASPVLPPVPSPLSTTHVSLGVATVTRSGRLREQRLTTELGWDVGERLRIDVADDVILLRRHTDGPYQVDSRRQVFIPAGTLALFGIATGDRVLLVAIPSKDSLGIHPLSAITPLFTRHYDALLGDELGR